MLETKELSVLEQLEESIDVIDPIKFFEYVKILDSNTYQIIKYEMWPHLVEFIKAISEHTQIIVLKSKQVGISWTIAALAIWWCYKTGANVIMISKGEDEAVELLRKAKFIYAQLPKYLQLELKDDAKTLLSFKSKQSRIHTLPSTEYAGVGETASLVIWDENEFHPNDKENWAHLKPTIDAGAHGIIVSTAEPTKLDSHFKTIWREARAGNNNFYPIFIPWYAVPNRTIDHTKDRAWLEHIKKDYYQEWQARANYPETEEEALSPILGRGVFDVGILQNLQREALKEAEIRQGVIYIYHRPKVGIQYIAGVDMAEGRGGDYSVLEIEGRDGLSREQVAVIHSNDILIDTFAYMAYELLKEYFNPRIVGGATPYEQAFYSALLARGYDRGKIYCSDEKREKLGFKESGQTQDKELVDLEMTIRGGLKIHYIPTIKELFAFQVKESKLGGRARLEAAEGSHDDLVRAMCKANFGFTQYKVDNQKITVSYPKTWRG